MNNQIIFVVVAYRAEEKALERLRRAFGWWPVIIVDNTKNNRGYAGGANLGIRKALDQGARWAVVINDDLKITKEFVQRFTDILKKSLPAIIGPFAGKLDQKRWTTILPTTAMGYISGSIFAVHKDIIDKIGYLYDPYFIYYEEVDFCIRAKRAGFPLRWLPLSGITHKESATMRKGSFLHQYYLSRNHLLFVERQALLRVKLYEYLRLPKTIYEHVYRREWGALLGVFHYFIRRFGQL